MVRLPKGVARIWTRLEATRLARHLANMDEAKIERLKRELIEAHGTYRRELGKSATEGEVRRAQLRFKAVFENVDDLYLRSKHALYAAWQTNATVPMIEARMKRPLSNEERGRVFRRALEKAERMTGQEIADYEKSGFVPDEEHARVLYLCNAVPGKLAGLLKHREAAQRLLKETA